MFDFNRKLKLTPWDELRRARRKAKEKLNRKDMRAVMKLVRKLDPVAKMIYDEWRRYYRRPKTRRIQSSRVGVIYDMGDLRKFLKRFPKLKWIHFAGYLSQPNYKWIVALLRKGVIKFFTVAHWSSRRLLQRKWYQSLADDIKGLVGEFCARVKFYSARMNSFINGLIQCERPFNEICAMLYQLYGHKITVRALIRMAVVKRWISLPRKSVNKHFKKKLAYRRPRRPPNCY